MAGQSSGLGGIHDPARVRIREWCPVGSLDGLAESPVLVLVITTDITIGRHKLDCLIIKIPAIADRPIPIMLLQVRLNVRRERCLPPEDFVPDPMALPEGLNGTTCARNARVEGEKRFGHARLTFALGDLDLLQSPAMPGLSINEHRVLKQQTNNTNTAK